MKWTSLALGKRYLLLCSSGSLLLRRTCVRITSCQTTADFTQENGDGLAVVQMKTASLIACCALGLLVVASTVYADSVIAVSGSKHFDDVLAKNDFVVAEFYAPW